MSIADKLAIINENVPKVYDGGFFNGFNDGMNQGFSEGYSIGEAEGYSMGEIDGHMRGHEEGYSQGYSQGYSEGEAEGQFQGRQEGYANGKQAEYDAFWDAFQDNGNRENYMYAFAGAGWTQANYNPKYQVKPKGDAGTMYRGCGIEVVSGVDFSQAEGMQYLFYITRKMREIGIVDASKVTNANRFSYAFNTCGAKSIEKLVFGTTSGTFSNVFNDASNLENLVIEGKINRNGLNFQWSPLTHDSLMSIINALEDYSTDTSGTAWTITLGATNVAKLTADELQLIRDKGWQYG